jgi:hypothetical protein
MIAGEALVVFLAAIVIPLIAGVALFQFMIR